MERPKVIAIVGPTAVGKTSLSIHIAQKFNAEIINGDSLQVYRGLDIGTAKVTPDEQDGVPHHLLDILDVKEPFTASQFKHAAQQAIQDITGRGKLPIIVGGSGLYIEGLLRGMQFGWQGQDEDFRKQLEEELREQGALGMWERLFQQDSVAAKAIHPNNSRRVIRALEAIHASGEQFSDQGELLNSPYDYLVIGLDCDRSLLYERINQRVDLMVEAGLLEEAKRLYDIPGSIHFQSVKGIGYKEWYPFFSGEMTFAEAKEAVKRNSRRYAKRQLTWFRNRMPEVKWFDAVGEELPLMVEAEVERFLKEPTHEKENGYAERKRTSDFGRGTDGPV